MANKAALPLSPNWYVVTEIIVLIIRIVNLKYEVAIRTFVSRIVATIPTSIIHSVDGLCIWMFPSAIGSFRH